MANEGQLGYFEFEAGDLDGTTTIIPKDQSGDAPSGEANPSDQKSYDIATDGEAHGYYVHIVNNLDVGVDWNIKQSHMFDPDLTDAVEIFDTDVTVASGDPDAYSGESNGSYFGVKITPASNPSSGKLIVVVQKVSV